MFRKHLLNEWVANRGTLDSGGWACGPQILHPIAVSQKGIELVPRRFCTHVPIHYLQITSGVHRNTFNPGWEPPRSRSSAQNLESTDMRCPQGEVTYPTSLKAGFFLFPYLSCDNLCERVCHLLVLKQTHELFCPHLHISKKSLWALRGN